MRLYKVELGHLFFGRNPKKIVIVHANDAKQMRELLHHRYGDWQVKQANLLRKPNVFAGDDLTTEYVR